MKFEDCGEIFESLPITAVELLGHAVNNVIEAGEMEADLPNECHVMLSSAIKLIRGVQSHLYNN